MADQCEFHTEIAASLAASSEAISSLKNEDVRIADEIKTLSAKVDTVDGRVQKVERNLAKYTGALAVIVVLMPLIIKLVQFVWSLGGHVEGVARAAGH